MMSYLLILIAFLTTIISLFGKTYNERKRTLTSLGCLSFFFATSVLILGIISIKDESKQRQENQKLAIRNIQIVINEIRQISRLAFNENENSEVLNSQLYELGLQLEQNLTIYNDLIQPDQKKELYRVVQATRRLKESRLILSKDKRFGAFGVVRSLTYLPEIFSKKVYDSISQKEMLDLLIEHHAKKN